jgi:nucleotide-binding universal stress UspA family protein
MKWSKQLAASYGATLRVTHVIAGFETGQARQVDRQFEEDMRLEARKNIEAQQKEAGVDAPLCITVGNAAAGVREEARRHGADLVVIGRGVIHETLGRLRTHAHAIIRQSPCPVLSV